MSKGPTTVKEALEARSKKCTTRKQKENTFVVYDVKAGSKIESRACLVLDIAKADDCYNLILCDRWGKPFVAPVEDREIFPWNKWERTEYSLVHDKFRFLEEDSYEQIKNWLDYLFWDTSTEFMVANGMPTDADVEVWKNIINQQTRLSDSERKNLIFSCEDYVKPKY